jgi:hypothetical protein
MLQQFSWQSFLIAALILSLIWYAGVLTLFYKKEITGFTSLTKPEPAQPLSHHWETKVDRLAPDLLQPDLMGKSRSAEGVQNVRVGDFGFAGDEDNRYAQIGLVADVLEDLKDLFRKLASQQGSKQDFFILIGALNLKYPGIGSHPGIDNINSFILQQASFTLSADELDYLWD